MSRERKKQDDFNKIRGLLFTRKAPKPKSVKQLAKESGFSIPKVTRIVNYLTEHESANYVSTKERRGKRGPLTTVYWWQY